MWSAMVSHTASVSLHCMTIRIQPPIRELLLYEARASGIGVPEKIRQILQRWGEGRPMYRQDLAKS